MRQHHHAQHPGSLLSHGPPKGQRFTNPAGGAPLSAGLRMKGFLPGFLLARARHVGAALVDFTAFGRVGPMSSVIGAA